MYEESIHSGNVLVWSIHPTPTAPSAVDVHSQYGSVPWTVGEIDS